MTRAPLWQIAVALAVAAIGAAMLGAGWQLYAGADRLLTAGEHAPGEVVQALAERRETRDPEHGAGQGQPMTVVVRGRMPVYAYEVEVPVMRFTALDGRVLEVRGADTVPGTVTVGSAAPVRYRPEEPEKARLESELADPTGPYALAALGAACLLSGLFVASRLSRRRA